MMRQLCPFFGKCGGCLYQDLSEESYIQKKKTFIERAFQDYGIDVHLEPMIQIPLHARRRADFAYQNGRVGYHAVKSHTLVPITTCLLLKPEIESFLPTLNVWAQKLGGRGEIFVLSTPFGLDIHIKTNKPIAPNFALLEQLALFAANPKVARLTYNNNPIAEKVKLPFLPDSFLQPSEEGEQTLINLMLENVKSEKQAVDLFCGCGTFTRPLLAKGLSVCGYDLSESVGLLGANGVKRDLFRSPLLAEELKNYDLIVIDPPRAGAKAQVEQIAETQVPKIIMISCDPKTAARDIKILLAAGWELMKVTPVDQFTWSNHIELVCVLVRPTSDRS